MAKELIGFVTLVPDVIQYNIGLGRAYVTYVGHLSQALALGWRSSILYWFRS